MQRITAFAKKRFTAMPGPLSRLPWALFGIVPNILYAQVFIFTLAVVAETLELPLLTNWLGQILNFLPQAIAAALLVIAGFVGGGIGIYVWSRSLGFVAAIVMAMVLSMMIAGMAGAAIPVLLKALKQDPAAASSILLTTVTDVFGFMSFLGLATVFSAWLS